MHRIELVQGDITALHVDAIVNAANESLLGGGGVDGAIHRAAGPGLLEECRRLDGCATGDAKVTAGHALPARYVIHTVGPVWGGGEENEDSLLAGCYACCFRLASEHRLRTIAFPAISTGIYRFPKVRACHIALRETRAALAGNDTIERVVFVCFSDPDLEVYREGLAV